MAQFMFLIRGGESGSPSPEEMQRMVEEYTAWARALGQAGKMVGGDELASGGRVVTSAGVTDGPFAESKEAVGGYFLIEAAGEDEAVAIAGQCPGLKRGGAVEVRAIVDHSGG